MSERIPVNERTIEGRTIVSLLLLIHLFCVAMVLCGNVMHSELQRDLASVVAPYTKTLHLDPNFVPFQLTSGDDGFSRLHQWQVIENDRITHRYPGDQWRGGFNRERQDMFARVGGFYALNDELNDEVVAAMSKAIAKQVFSTSPTSKRIRVRCVRFVGDSDALTADINSDDVATLYAADVWLSESGSVNLLKFEEPHRSAPPVIQNVE